MHESQMTRRPQPQLPAGRSLAWGPPSIVAFTIAGIALLLGCEAAQPPAATVPVAFEDLPRSFVETAKKELPGVRFDSAFRKPNGTLEIRGREKNGKVREVEIRPDGTVEEVE